MSRQSSAFPLIITSTALFAGGLYWAGHQHQEPKPATAPTAGTAFVRMVDTHELPDAKMTPGAVLTTDAHEICTRPTSDIRHVTAATKRAVYEEYGDPEGNHAGFCSVPEGCEVDHLISLELGGSNDPSNLWPEPYTGTRWNAHVKDRIENELHREICDGEETPQQAQQEIAGNWITAYCRRWPDADCPAASN